MTKSVNNDSTSIWQELNNAPGMKPIAIRHWIRKHRDIKRLPFVRRINDSLEDFLAAEANTHF
jgi:hypothetical protein